jgi:hypothetical protein
MEPAFTCSRSSRGFTSLDLCYWFRSKKSASVKTQLGHVTWVLLLAMEWPTSYPYTVVKDHNLAEVWVCLELRHPSLIPRLIIIYPTFLVAKTAGFSWSFDQNSWPMVNQRQAAAVSVGGGLRSAWWMADQKVTSTSGREHDCVSPCFPQFFRILQYVLHFLDISGYVWTSWCDSRLRNKAFVGWCPLLSIIYGDLHTEVACHKSLRCFFFGSRRDVRYRMVENIIFHLEKLWVFPIVSQSRAKRVAMYGPTVRHQGTNLVSFKTCLKQLWDGVLIGIWVKIGYLLMDNLVGETTMLLLWFRKNMIHTYPCPQ